MLPHEAPVPRRAPFTQTGEPVVQAMEPLKQGLVGVQAEPAAQFAHEPALSQTCPEPQVVPGALLPPSMQRSAPVEQSETPLRQSPGFVPQVCPALHAMQAPAPLHTCPAPHERPAPAFVESRHTVLPVVQLVTPVRQGAPGLLEQLWLATQAPQFPLASQTCPAPQFVPAALLLPSMHSELPLAQVVMPLRHDGDGFVVQGRFATQVTHEPARLHTWFMPQLVPAERLPESTQVCAPVVQAVTPVLQPGFGFEVHDVPATQAMQLPAALHTRSGPHAVPGVTFVESTQRVEPVLQSMMPDLHGAPGLELHDAPAMHAPQKPLASQVCAAPHDVPAIFGAPSTQTWLPLAHEKTPARQGEGLVVQLPPAAHATHIPAEVQT